MHRLALALAAISLASCVLASRESARESARGAGSLEPPAWAAPDLQRLVVVRDGHTGEELLLPDLLDALADADVVFLGETHTDETTHRVELAVYEGLLARRDGGVVLALEMFERDVQQALDDYLAGRTDEAAFLAAARPWKNYATAYRPLIESAREAGGPVLASNFPRPVRTRLAKEGPDVLASLQSAGSREVPAEILPSTDAYWRRVDNAVRGHKNMLGGSDSADARLLSTQSLWDNSMGESCARALDEHPGDLVLHVNGGFHSAWWDGTVRQLHLRKPAARVVTVAIEPVSSPATADVRGAPAVDYIVFAEQRAEDLDSGAGSVLVQREIGYRFHMPGHANVAATAEGTGKATGGATGGATANARGGERVPLLIWLSDDGLTAEDGLDLWRERLGDEAAIAVIEAPNVELQADLAPGGRWFGSDDFLSDVDTVATAVDRIWAYLLQHERIDPTRVCLAGEGTGATVVVAIALLTDRMDVQAVALGPRRYAGIHDIPLPLPEERGGEPRPDTSLRVLLAARAGAAADNADAANTGDAAWWTAELGEYAGIGLQGELVATSDDPWQRHSQSEDALRAGLGLSALQRSARAADTMTATGAAPAAAAPDARRYVLVEDDSPRARHWARMFALREAAQDGGAVAVLAAPPDDPSTVRIALDVRPAAFIGDDALPPCPGDFGGTTVIVLPEHTSAEDVAAWKAIEADDPLNRKNRFNRLRMALAGPGGARIGAGNPPADRPGDLAAVLSELVSAGRVNVLIVPATFHAGAESMLSLQRSVATFEARLTLHWLPGLGQHLKLGTDALPAETGTRSG